MVSSIQIQAEEDGQNRARSNGCGAKAKFDLLGFVGCRVRVPKVCERMVSTPNIDSAVLHPTKLLRAVPLVECS